MTDSPNLALPYLQSQQAQKRVTRTEAQRRLGRQGIAAICIGYRRQVTNCVVVS